MSHKLWKATIYFLTSFFSFSQRKPPCTSDSSQFIWKQEHKFRMGNSTQMQLFIYRSHPMLLVGQTNVFWSLGPLLFIMYIIDLSQIPLSPHILLYVDIWSNITSPDNQSLLQEGLCLHATGVIGQVFLSTPQILVQLTSLEILSSRKII